MRREMMIKGQMTYNDVIEADLKADKHNGEWRDMRMLLGIYFPQLGPEFDGIILRRTNMNAVLLKIMRAYREHPSFPPRA